MARVPASERTRNALKNMFAGKTVADKSSLVRPAARLIVEEALEKEAVDALGSGYYEHVADRRGYRNGYRTSRVKSAEGAIEFAAPQLAEMAQPFRSKIREVIRGRTEELEPHVSLFGLVIAALFSGRMLILGSHWQGADALHEQVSAAVDEIPRGSRLLAVSVLNPEEPFEAPGPHIAATAVVQRDVFLPSMYAMPRGQPLTFTEQYQALASNAPKPDQWSGDLLTWKQVEQDYDFILLTGRDRLKVAPPDSLVTVSQGNGFRLYKTRRSLEAEH
jgi:Transposase, Mutator family